ncbi:unnamed protein product [Phyllotreta striolata]|uniref:Max-binding protein MNT n=1 Tax=Phyllotreta striolata TaxID=444603 RepID=A0A9N9TGS3_PHYSR|nr:unnamed protein product [Phyllotreta striolata]
MSLSTLLEAARFLEMQEQQNNRTTVAAETLATMTPVATTVKKEHVQQNGVSTIALSQAAFKTVTANTTPQTVVISSSNLSQAILQGVQGPIAISTTPPAQLQLKKDHQDQQVSSTTLPQLPRQQRVLHNSFDIRNTGGNGTGASSGKRKQPPLVFRAGTREVHNKLEKHRRAHLKECFDILKKQLPSRQDEKKPSNLSILHSALRYIQALKRKERELEHEMERLAREKISAQQRLAVLKKDIMSHYDNIDFSKILPEGNGSLKDEPVSVKDEVDDVEEISFNGNCAQNDDLPEVTTIPILPKPSIPVVTQNLTTIKEVSQPVQTTALSVLPMTYPVNQLNSGLVLQKVAIVPKGLDHLTPLVSTHFITPQQINGGKVVPLTQYLVKPVVVVSTASPRPS